MSNTQILGRLETVDPREVWASEAGDFTPWLAREENLALLGDTISLDLEHEATEKDVGPFRADILCKDTATGDWVLIENQLARTDHTHLGQLMTYAAGLKAATIVWIADRFTDEHRAAMDWLNEITGEKFGFFALEVELWRIGESAVAPKFNVVSKPNDWTKPPPPSVGEVTETKQLQQEYWAAMRERILDQDRTPLRPQKPQPAHWTNFSVGRSHFTLSATVNTQKNGMAVELSCAGPDAKPHFFLLQEDRAAIEQEIGDTLEWEELPDRKTSRISLRRWDTDPTNRSDWPAQHVWLIGTLENFHRTFSARVKALDASDYRPDEEDLEESG